MKRTFILFSILFTFSIQGQQLIDLYLPVIPQKLLDTPEEKQMVETNLEFYADIHPDLIGYYLMHLKSYFKDGNKDPEKNNLNLLKMKRGEYQELRKEWAEDQIAEINKSDLHRSQKKIASENYAELIKREDFIQKFKFDQQIPLDSNYHEYISGIFFSNKFEEYEPTRDYKLKNRIFVHDIINSIELQKMASSSMSETEKENLLNRIKKYWYIIGKKGQKRYSISTSFEAYELSELLLTGKYPAERGLYFTLGSALSVIPVDIPHNFSFFNDLEMPLVVPERVHVRPGTLFDAGIGYRLIIGEDSKPLSVLDFLAQYKYSKNEYLDDNVDKILRQDSYNAGGGLKYRTFASSGFEESSSHTFSLFIQSPMIYLNEKSIISAGIVTHLHTMNVKYKITEYSGTNIPDDHQGADSYEQIEQNYLSFSPVISYKYNLSDSFNIGGSSYLLINGVQVALRLEFQFN